MLVKSQNCCYPVMMRFRSIWPVDCPWHTSMNRGRLASGMQQTGIKIVNETYRWKVCASCEKRALRKRSVSFVTEACVSWEKHVGSVSTVEGRCAARRWRQMLSASDDMASLDWHPWVGTGVKCVLSFTASLKHAKHVFVPAESRSAAWCWRWNVLWTSVFDWTFVAGIGVKCVSDDTASAVLLSAWTMSWWQLDWLADNESLHVFISSRGMYAGLAKPDMLISKWGDDRPERQTLFILLKCPIVAQSVTVPRPGGVLQYFG